MPHVLGVGATAFRRHPDRSHADLAGEAVRAALSDACLTRAPIELIYFGSTALSAWGQGAIGGQVVLDPTVRAGDLPSGVPIVNVEAGCATGGAALHASYLATLAESADLVLAVGVDKLFFPGAPEQTLAAFLSGIDNLDPDRWRAFHASFAAQHDLAWRPDPRRLVFLDVHELHLQRHAARWGTPREAVARLASKARSNGALNPKAQFQTALTSDDVLAEPTVVGWLTRAMCAPVSDGAAAALICSDRWLRDHPDARAVPLRAVALAGGAWDGEASVHTRAAAACRRRAGPAAVDLVELHDATSGDELLLLEALGLAEPGAAAADALAGRFDRDGALPVNPSGGLVSKGHPLAATGLGMVEELVTQLRGEAGPRQVRARTALLHNAGGMIGVEEATAVVAIFGA
jgi:acetyl-CoA acetyltransferase